MNIKLYIEVNNDWTNWYIELYENCSCNNKNELCKREGEIIRLIGTLNSRIEGRDRKQYCIDNADTIKENNKQYYINNADMILENQKQYRINNADKVKENNKQYYIDNVDKVEEYNKQYRIDNVDKIKEQKKQYYIDKKQYWKIKK